MALSFDDQKFQYDWEEAYINDPDNALDSGNPSNAVSFEQWLCDLNQKKAVHHNLGNFYSVSLNNIVPTP